MICLKKYWKEVKEKDASLALLKNDQQDCDYQIMSIKFENIEFQDDIQAKDQQIEFHVTTDTNSSAVTYTTNAINRFSDAYIYGVAAVAVFATSAWAFFSNYQRSSQTSNSL